MFDGPDIGYRTYIYNSSSFTINKYAKFVIDENGDRYIENMAVYAFDDNFDFKSSDPVAEALNPDLKQLVDPSGLGRTINITFSGKENVPVQSVYNSAQYFSDVESAYSHYSMSNVINALSGVYDITSKLYGSGAGPTAFLDGKSRPIIYRHPWGRPPNHQRYYKSQLSA